MLGYLPQTNNIYQSSPAYHTHTTPTPWPAHTLAQISFSRNCTYKETTLPSHTHVATVTRSRPIPKRTPLIQRFTPQPEQHPKYNPPRRHPKQAVHKRKNKLFLSCEVARHHVQHASRGMNRNLSISDPGFDMADRPAGVFHPAAQALGKPATAAAVLRRWCKNRRRRHHFDCINTPAGVIAHLLLDTTRPSGD